MESNSYKFIDGTFTADEAEKILNAIFNYKIDYHEREDFSNHIRHGKDIGYSTARIQQLKDTKEAIRKLIEKSKSENSTLSINSVINITLEDKNV